MYIRELLDLTNWIEINIVEKRTRELLNDLIAVMLVNAQPGNPKSPFNAQQENVLQVIASINLDSLTIEQINILDQLGITPYVGKRGVSAITDFIVLNPIDIVTALEKLKNIAALFEATVAKSNQIKAAFREFQFPESKLGDDVLLRVRFASEASINDVVDLKKWSEVWFEIGRGVSMLHGKAPEDVRVVGAGTGSILIDLAVGYAIAKTVAGIFLEAFKVAEKYLDLKQKAQDIRSAGVSQEVVGKIEETAEKQKDEGVIKIVHTIKLEVSPKADGEVEKVLTKAVENLIGFIQKGGDVEYLLPPTASTDTPEAEIEPSPRRELLLKVKEIKQLKEKIDPTEIGKSLPPPTAE